MGLKVNFQFTISSIILALFAIAFSAVVNADCDSQYTYNPGGSGGGGCSTVTVQGSNNPSPASNTCYSDKNAYCQNIYACYQKAASNGNTECLKTYSYDVSVKGNNLQGCSTQTGSTCMNGNDDDEDPEDVASDTKVTSSCKTQMANTYCCRSQTDKTSAQTDDKATQELQEKLFNNQKTDQQNLQSAQDQMTQIQNDLSQKLLSMQNTLNQNQEAVGTKQDALNAQISADNAKIQGSLQSIQTTISNGQQAAQAAYQAAMTQASADCRSMQFQYQQPGNAAQLGSLTNALNSSSHGGLMNARCGVGQASINTPWGQKYIAEQSAAQQAYYSAVAALNAQVAEFKNQVLQIQSDITNCQQQISRLIANQMIEAQQIQQTKNTTVMTANQSIQTQMSKIQQIRQQDQQQGAALQQQLQKDMNVQKQSDSDFTDSQKYCKALQSYQTSTSCSSSGTTNITVGGSSGSDNGSNPARVVSEAISAQNSLNSAVWGNCAGVTVNGTTWTAGTIPDASGNGPSKTAVTPTTPASQQPVPASVPDWCPSGDGCAEK